MVRNALVFALFCAAVVFTLVLFLSGCGGMPPTPTSRDKAVMLVWEQSYGMGGAGMRSAPTVNWRTDLDCAPDALGRFKGWRLQVASGPDIGDIICVGGVFWHSAWYAQVAMPAGYPLHETALAHELYHAALHALFDRGEVGGVANGDAEHEGPGWKPGGAVEKANEKLRAAGL